MSCTMSADLDSSASAFSFNNVYTDPLSKSEINNHYFLHRNEGTLPRASRNSQLKRSLNELAKAVEVKKPDDSTSPNENLLTETRTSTSKARLPQKLSYATDQNADAICAKQARTISIHETYQLGYFDTASDTDLIDRLYVFDFVDGLEVTYPISVTSSHVVPTDLPPLFLEPEYVDQLSTLASSALNQLTNLINNWLTSCQRSKEEFLIWHYATADEEAISLRKQIVQLIDQLVPNGQLESRIDFQSPATDNFLAQLAKALTINTLERPTIDVPSEDAIPLVSLCPDPEHCLNSLRTQIFQLLQILVPQLRLPQSFRLERDLQPLLSTMYKHNARCN